MVLPPTRYAAWGDTAKGGAIIFSNDFRKVTHLRFTPTGTVMRVSGDYLDGDFVGLDKEQVRAKVGEPHSRTLREFQIIYRYTAPGKRGSGTYKKREVRFGASNLVIRPVSEMYYD